MPWMTADSRRDSNGDRLRCCVPMRLPMSPFLVIAVASIVVAALAPFVFGVFQRAA